MANVKKGITSEMIANFEANLRATCLFCEAGGLENLEGYSSPNLPEGFYCTAFRCPKCGRAWREISKFEEINLQPAKAKGGKE